MAVTLSTSFLICLSFVSYWISSITTVFLNKFFLTKSDYNFSIIFVQNAVSVLLSYFWVKGFSRTSRIRDILTTPATRKLLILMTLVYCTTLSLNNVCLRLVTVSFFQVARSLNLISTVIFSYLMIGQKHSPRSLFCCAFVVGGFWLTVDQESGLGTLSILGVLFGLSASISLGVQVVLIKKTLDALSLFQNPDALLCLFMNLFSLPILFVLCVGSGEVSSIVQHANDETQPVSFTKFWSLIVISGALTFAIAVASNACIRLTAPLSHNISVQTKSVVQTIVACWFYNETKTWLWWIGNYSVVFGAAAYTYTKFVESRNPKPAFSFNIPVPSSPKKKNGNGSLANGSNRSITSNGNGHSHMYKI